MALPLVVKVKVVTVQVDNTATVPREHVLMKPVEVSGDVVDNGAPIRLIIEDVTKQGLLLVNTFYTMTFTAFP